MNATVIGPRRVLVTRSPTPAHPRRREGFADRPALATWQNWLDSARNAGPIDPRATMTLAWVRSALLDDADLARAVRAGAWVAGLVDGSDWLAAVTAQGVADRRRSARLPADHGPGRAADRPSPRPAATHRPAVPGRLFAFGVWRP